MNRVGNQNPTYRYSTKYKYSEGSFACEISENYALKCHPWQELVLQDWLAVDAKGKLLNSKGEKVTILHSNKNKIIFLL